MGREHASAPALSPNPRCGLIVVVGRSGVGKSTLQMNLSRSIPNCVRLSLGELYRSVAHKITERVRAESPQALQGRCCFQTYVERRRTEVEGYAREICSRLHPEVRHGPDAASCLVAFSYRSPDGSSEDLYGPARQRPARDVEDRVTVSAVTRLLNGTGSVDALWKGELIALLNAGRFVLLDCRCEALHVTRTLRVPTVEVYLDATKEQVGLGQLDRRLREGSTLDELYVKEIRAGSTPNRVVLPGAEVMRRELADCYGDLLSARDASDGFAQSAFEECYRTVPPGSGKGWFPLAATPPAYDQRARAVLTLLNDVFALPDVDVERSSD